MLEQFLNHIEENDLCGPSQKILLAVSGGVDSIVMLHLFKEAGYAIGVAHCNFQLRGNEAIADETVVKNLCEEFQLPFHIKRFETEAFASQQKVSIQMAARELRYGWFNELLDHHGYDHLATAHHVNDSIETVLLKWIHGGALESFSGIPVKNKQIIRPMLFASRESIESYAVKNKLSWRNDSSNETDDYQRNLIRHRVIPMLKEINPSLETTFQHGQKKTLGELLFLEKQIEEWKSAHINVKGNNILIDKELFANVDYADSLLWKVIREFGFNIDQCRAVIRALKSQPGKKFIGASHLLTLDRGHLIISPYDDFDETIEIKNIQDAAVRGPWRMSIEKSFSETGSHNPMIAFLDSEKIKFPIQWRTWKPGDYFYPLGMDNKKKLSDFLIDKKISLSDKNGVSVLESDGQIIWVVGHRIDNRFKIMPGTKSVLQFSVHPHFT